MVMDDQLMATVYVATIPLKYEVIAVAATKDEAIRLVGNLALKRLREAYKPRPVDPEVNTAKKIVEYHGVQLTKLEVGTAATVGDGIGWDEK